MNIIKLKLVMILITFSSVLLAHQENKVSSEKQFDCNVLEQESSGSLRLTEQFKLTVTNKKMSIKQLADYPCVGLTKVNDKITCKNNLSDKMFIQYHFTGNKNLVLAVAKELPFSRLKLTATCK